MISKKIYAQTVWYNEWLNNLCSERSQLIKEQGEVIEKMKIELGETRSKLALLWKENEELKKSENKYDEWGNLCYSCLKAEQEPESAFCKPCSDKAKKKFKARMKAMIKKAKGELK